MHMNWRFDEEKFVNAALFFAVNSHAQSFGITKLNKQLYYSDFEHFKQYGRPIIGDRYTRMKNGPVPSTAYNIINELLNGVDGISVHKRLAKKIEVKRGKFRGRTIHRITPLAEPDLSVFSKSEVKIMRAVAEVCTSRRLSASFLSRLTHIEGSPWSRTENNQEIDYRLALDESERSLSKDYVDFWNKEMGDFEDIVKSLPPHGTSRGAA